MTNAGIRSAIKMAKSETGARSDPKDPECLVLSPTAKGTFRLSSLQLLIYFNLGLILILVRERQDVFTFYINKASQSSPRRPNQPRGSLRVRPGGCLSPGKAEEQQEKGRSHGSTPLQRPQPSYAKQAQLLPSGGCCPRQSPASLGNRSTHPKGRRPTTCQAQHRVVWPLHSHKSIPDSPSNFYQHQLRGRPWGLTHLLGPWEGPCYPGSGDKRALRSGESLYSEEGEGIRANRQERLGELFQTPPSCVGWAGLDGQAGGATAPASGQGRTLPQSRDAAVPEGRGPVCGRDSELTPPPASSLHYQGSSSSPHPTHQPWSGPSNCPTN